MRKRSKHALRAALCACVTLVVSASGAAVDDAPVSLPIRTGDQWHYFKGLTAPPANWTSRSFDDSQWLRGPSSFGIAGHHATPLTDMYGRYTSLFIRHRFYVADPAAIHALMLEMEFDDGFVAYINGVESARANMTGEPPPYDAGAWPPHAIGTPEDYPVSQAALKTLVPGYNVLAIQGHNWRLWSRTFTLAPKLAVPNAPPSAAALIAPPDGGVPVPSGAPLSVHVSDPEEERMNVSFYGRATSFPLPSEEADFTIVALPDTQIYSQGRRVIFVDQTGWIVENRAAMNIAYVAHLGDVVNSFGESGRFQFENAEFALRLLEGEPPVPYGLAVGNHDGGPSETRLFNEFFGVDRFDSRPWYGGHYQEDNDNHYDLFTAGGMDFIAIYLEYTTQSHGDVLRWADKILNRYHDRRAIVVSHYLIGIGEPGLWGQQGQAIYDALKDNPNLFLMLCGHIPGEGYRFETFNGNSVRVVLSNYQERANGGDGWLRLYRFSPANNTISVFTYSPWRGEYERDADSEFVLPYDMSKPAFERVARVRQVESDTDIEVEWPGRSPCGRYQWYVTATDGITPTTGPVWQFRMDDTGGPPPCDTNCDGVVDGLDISPFIDLLLGESTGCSLCAGDANGDGFINALDIEPFLECLSP